MATAATVDGNGGLWLPLSELARLRGVTKGPLSRRVARFEEQGISLSRPGPGNTKLINVAAFDRATEETTDVVRATNGGDSTAVAAPSPQLPGEALVYSREQARNAAYAADLKWLERNERLGLLLPIDDVVEAMTQCADALVREMSDLPMRADEIAAAVARDGEAGARRELKRIETQMRVALSAAMQRLADAAKAAHEQSSVAADAKGVAADAKS